MRSFRDAEAEKIFHLRRSRRLPPDIQQVALRKLRMLSRAQTLQDLRVPPANHLEVQGKRSITPDTALRLALHFNMSPHFWLGLQMDYDLDVARMRLANASGVKWPCLHDAKG